MAMIEITREEPDGSTTWVNDVDCFCYAVELARYLRRAAPAGSYEVRGESIRATAEAIRAAVAAYKADCEALEAQWDAMTQ
jgi:hypothetical protein